MVLRQAGRLDGWQAVEAMRNVPLWGVGWGNCDEKISSKLPLDKKIHTFITRKESYKGLRKIYLEH